MPTSDATTWRRRLNSVEPAVRMGVLCFGRRSRRRFHARSRWRACEAGDGRLPSSISGEEERDWRSGQELRRNVAGAGRWRSRYRSIDMVEPTTRRATRMARTLVVGAREKRCSVVCPWIFGESRRRRSCQHNPHFRAQGQERRKHPPRDDKGRQRERQVQGDRRGQWLFRDHHDQQDVD